MQLTFKSTPLSYLQSRLRQVQNQEQTLELRLSEGMPDLGRLLLTGGQARLSSKQWRSDSVSITGGIQAWALYLPEDGSEPMLLEGWIPFQAKWNLPEHCREGILDARITLRNLDGRILSPRKVLLRASVALCAEALCPGEVSAYSPEEVPEGIHLLQKSYPVRLWQEAGEKVFSLEDSLADEGSLPEKLLCCHMTPRLTEQTVAGDQLILRGILNVHYLGMDGEGKLHSGNLELPFAQLAQLDGEYDKEATANVSLSIAASDWQQEDQQLKIRCELVAQYRILGQCVLHLAQDAYSPRTQLQLQREELTLPALLDERTEQLEITQGLQLGAEQIVEVAFYPDEPVTYREADQLISELPGQIQVLYTDEHGSLQSLWEPFCGRWELPAGESCNLRLYCGLESVAAPVMQNGQVQLKAILKLEAGAWTEQSLPMVTGMELGEKRNPDPARPSVILRRAGEDTLWELAKGHGSTVDAICKANRLTGEPDPKQMLLIPVL